MAAKNRSKVLEFMRKLRPFGSFGRIAMAAIDNQLKRLESAVNALVAEQQLLKKENELLRRERQELSQKVDGLEQELQNAKQNLQTARMAQGLGPTPEDARLAKAKISSLMREIDRCVALLND